MNTTNAVTGWSFRMCGDGTAWTVVCVNFFALLPLRSTRASRPPRYRLCSPKILKNLRLFWVAHNHSPVIPLCKKIICLVPEIFCLEKIWFWLTDMFVTSGLYKNYITSELYWSCTWDRAILFNLIQNYWAPKNWMLTGSLHCLFL